MAPSYDLSVLPSVLELQSKETLMIGVGVAFLTIVWISMALRIYVRVFMVKSFGWDDVIMLLSAVSFSTFAALLIIIAKYGYNKSVIEAYATSDLFLIMDVLTEALQYVVVYNALYVLTTILFKISIAIFFLRIVVLQWQRRLLYYTTAIYTVYSIIFIFIVAFRCGDPKHLLLNAARGKCISNNVITPMLYICSISNTLLDFMFACLPATILWRSQMPRKAKISCGILLSMGGLGCLASVIRLGFLGGVTGNGTHFFAQAIDTGLLSVIEPGFAITAASLGTLRPLFKSMMERSLPSFTGWTGANNSRKHTRITEHQHELDKMGGTVTLTTVAARLETNSGTQLQEPKQGNVSVNRTASQMSDSSLRLLDEDLGSEDIWTTYDGRGVMMTRHVHVSNR